MVEDLLIKFHRNQYTFTEDVTWTLEKCLYVLASFDPIAFISTAITQ